jgi:hypothetical protein
MTPQCEISRKSLFEMVWSQPMTKLAAQFKISDVALTKICRRHEIPVPGRGFWARVAAGQRLERPELRLPSRPELEDIRIFGSSHSRVKPEIREAEREAKAMESAADRKILVSQRLVDLHPIAQATLQRLRKEKANDHGVVASFGPDLFSVAVSPSQVDRSIRILNAVARASAERGFSVERGKNSACLLVNGEQLEFLLNEKINREPHKETPAEKARAEREKKRWPSDLAYRPWWMPQWDYSPSGLLVLELEEHHHSGLRRIFRDGKRQQLEDLLNDFLAAAVAYAAAEKAWREEHERQRREWVEQEQRRIEKREQVERNRKRWKFVSERIRSLERADKIDRFVQYIESACSAKNSVGENVRRFVDWAKVYSSVLKSVCDPSELDRVLEEDELFKPPTIVTDKWFEIVSSD